MGKGGISKKVCSAGTLLKILNIISDLLDTLLLVKCYHSVMAIVMLWLYPRKLRMSVNNKDIIRMYLGYSWLITQKTLPINTSFVNSEQWPIKASFDSWLHWVITEYKIIFNDHFIW